MSYRIKEPFGSNALKKGSDHLGLAGPQQNSPQTCHSGMSFDYFLYLLTLHLILQWSFCLQMDFSHGNECYGKYQRKKCENQIALFGWSCYQYDIVIWHSHNLLQHLQLQISVKFDKMAHPIQLHAPLRWWGLFLPPIAVGTHYWRC